jgi:hypothetical protein
MSDNFSNQSSGNSGYIFQAKTDEAFVIKILAELLNNRLQFAQFKINENGIFLLTS